jgi:hypothetical protein
MDKNNKIKVSASLLIILGIVMIYIGGFYGPKLILPPVITGIGFFIIAWVLYALKE